MAMSKDNIYNKRVGILGAGQLGLMLGQSASPLGLKLHYLDKSPDFPASLISQQIQSGDFKSYDDVMAFGQDMDVLSIEIENVNTDALIQLEKQGKTVYPQPSIIETIKDKGLQKVFYQEQDLPTSSFDIYYDKQAIESALQNGALSYPFVQKSRLAGYDGKGVAVIKSKEDNSKIMDTPSMVEDMVDIKKELAVIVGRTKSGEIFTFDTTEMVFNPKGNLLDYLIAPADIPKEIDDQCQQIAQSVIKKFNLIGILAVELFYTQKEEVLINEVAPRPHNSGHHTIEAYDISQYDMLRNILFDIPFNKPMMQSPSAILNLLGEEGATGPARLEGLDRIAELSNVFPHIYGKHTTKPLRKMGHVTVLGKDKSEIIEKIKFIQAHLKMTV